MLTLENLYLLTKGDIHLSDEICDFRQLFMHKIKSFLRLFDPNYLVLLNLKPKIKLFLNCSSPSLQSFAGLIR